MSPQGLSFQKKRYIKHIAEYKVYLTEQKAIVIDNIKKPSVKNSVAYKQEFVEEIEKETETIIQNETNLKNYDLLLSIKGINDIVMINTQTTRTL